jgi:cathepsin L
MISRIYCIAAIGMGLAFYPSLVDAIAIRGNLRMHPKPADLTESTSSEDNCDTPGLSFAEFMQKHGRTYVIGSQEYNDRKAIFDARAEEIRSQNCRPGKRLWTAGINLLSDRTVEELDRLRGRKGKWEDSMQPQSGGGYAATERLATLERKAATISRRDSEGGAPAQPLPDSFSWSDLMAMNDITDQGDCGSCWASATTKMLEAHAEIYQGYRRFSIQQIVSCAPNPQECGGNGGCNGSTGELALDYVMHNGLKLEKEFPYKAKDEPCPADMSPRHPFPVPQPTASSLLAIDYGASPARQFGMLGWNKLPENKLNPLYFALYQEGPIAVSVVASRSWDMYDKGIMDNCTTDHMVVNHLVTLIGYGIDADTANTKYWQIQNSWSNTWGEGGHIRVIRQEDNTAEQEFCGTDNDPSVGTGCKGGPSSVWVCGSCGLLYDNVVPHFVGDTVRAEEMTQRRSMDYLPPL